MQLLVYTSSHSLSALALHFPGGVVAQLPGSPPPPHPSIRVVDACPDLRSHLALVGSSHPSYIVFDTPTPPPLPPSSPVPLVPSGLPVGEFSFSFPLCPFPVTFSASIAPGYPHAVCLRATPSVAPSHPPTCCLHPLVLSALLELFPGRPPVSPSTSFAVAALVPFSPPPPVSLPPHLWPTPVGSFSSAWGATPTEAIRRLRRNAELLSTSFFFPDEII